MQCSNLCGINGDSSHIGFTNNCIATGSERVLAICQPETHVTRPTMNESSRQDNWLTSYCSEKRSGLVALASYIDILLVH